MKPGLLTSAIVGGLLVAPACANAQERPIVTITAGHDIGVGFAKTYENGGVLSMDLGLMAFGGSARSSGGAPVYGDIGGGFRSGSIRITGILGFAVERKDCACLWPKPVYGFAAKDNEPERWHPMGFRAGVGAIVSVKNLALGAKAIHGPRHGGRYSAWLGIAVGKDWLKKALGDRRKTVSRPD